MPRQSHNLAFDDSEQSFSVTKQSLAAAKQSFRSLETTARDILLNAGERGKWWVDRLDVSKGQISSWMSGAKISKVKIFQIVRIWQSEIRPKNKSLEERMTAWEHSVVWAHYGPSDNGDF